MKTISAERRSKELSAIEIGAALHVLFCSMRWGQIDDQAATMAGYHQALKDLPMQAIDRAASAYLLGEVDGQSLVFAPTPAELRTRAKAEIVRARQRAAAEAARVDRAAKRRAAEAFATAHRESADEEAARLFRGDVLMMAFRRGEDGMRRFKAAKSDGDVALRALAAEWRAEPDPAHGLDPIVGGRGSFQRESMPASNSGPGQKG